MFLPLLTETTVKHSFSSDFSDFKMIIDIVFHWLGYELHFFGFTTSIFSVVISCLILSIAITSIIKLFVGD